MEYFQHAARPLPPFPEPIDNYDNLISLWLAHCAALAYEGKYKVAANLKNVGFTRVLFFDQAGTQAYLARRPPKEGSAGLCIVAFRGTEKDYKDILSDITLFKRTIDYDHSFRVHGGFLTALYHVWGSYWKPDELNDSDFSVERVGPLGITEKLAELREDGDLVYFTGHSLGGAIANLAGYQYDRIRPEELTAIYTIGSPRSADKEMANHIRRNARYPVYRIVNAADIVPRVPPLLLGFRHFGTCVYLTRSGDKKIDPSLILLFRSAMAGLAPLLYKITPFRFLKAWNVRAFSDHGNAQYRNKLGNLIG